MKTAEEIKTGDKLYYYYGLPDEPKEVTIVGETNQYWFIDVCILYKNEVIKKSMNLNGINIYIPFYTQKGIKEQERRRELWSLIKADVNPSRWHYLTTDKLEKIAEVLSSEE